MATSKSPNDYSWDALGRLLNEPDPDRREARLEKWLEAGWNPFAPQGGGHRAIRRIASDAWALSALSQWAGAEKGRSLAEASDFDSDGRGDELSALIEGAMFLHRRQGEIRPEMDSPVRWLFESLAARGAVGPDRMPAALHMLVENWGESRARSLAEFGAPGAWFGGNDPEAVSRCVQAVAEKGDSHHGLDILTQALGSGATLAALAHPAAHPKEPPPWDAWSCIMKNSRLAMARAALALGHRPDWAQCARRGWAKGSMGDLLCGSAPWELAEKAALAPDRLQRASMLAALWSRPDCAGKERDPAFEARLRAIRSDYGSGGSWDRAAQEALTLCQARHLRAAVKAAPAKNSPSTRL